MVTKNYPLEIIVSHYQFLSLSQRLTFKNLKHKYFYSISWLIYSLLELANFLNQSVGKHMQITAYHNTPDKMRVNINDSREMLELLKNKVSW